MRYRVKSELRTFRNTFVMVPETGRCRAVRQDGDSIDRIQEAIDICPIDCIHWFDFEHRD